MNNTTKQPSKFTRFLRNNAALLLLIFCVLAIAAVVLAVTLTRDDAPVIPDNPVTGNPNDTNPDDDKPTTPKTEKVNVYFAAPVQYTGLGMEFTYGPSNLFAFNSTLKEWRVHKAVDLLTNENAEVSAMYDGTVIDTGESLLRGSYVVVDHGDNVIATYESLSDLAVTKGDSVKKGDLLGIASASAGKEYKDGSHLHLEVAVNGSNVDPMPYVKGEIYRTIEVEVKD